MQSLLLWDSVDIHILALTCLFSVFDHLELCLVTLELGFCNIDFVLLTNRFCNVCTLFFAGLSNESPALQRIERVYANYAAGIIRQDLKIGARVTRSTASKTSTLLGLCVDFCYSAYLIACLSTHKACLYQLRT